MTVQATPTVPSRLEGTVLGPALFSFWPFETSTDLFDFSVDPFDFWAFAPIDADPSRVAPAVGFLA